jgi:hypothetical protein
MVHGVPLACFMKIEIAKLEDRHRGRPVTYRSSGAKVEHGTITSWNDKFIFVRYHAVVWPEFRQRLGETSEATDPEDLEWGWK